MASLEQRAPAREKPRLRSSGSSNQVHRCNWLPVESLDLIRILRADVLREICGDRD